MKELEGIIKAHLISQYDGVLLPSLIDNHIRNYVQNFQSDYLIQKISSIIKAGAKILDIGSGYGSFVLSAIQNGYDAYGIELAEFEYKISKEKALVHNIDPKRFLLGSAVDLPYLDESFDVVCFWNVLEHVENYKLVIKESKRVLKPGGLIFIIAPNYCAFRKEAHYHLPWFPMFPKPLARLYLRAFGRKTNFLDDCIFYITIFNLKRYLKSQNLYVSIDINEKIKKGYRFQSKKINTLIAFCRKYKLDNLLKKAIFLLKTHPFSHSIDLIAKK